MTSPIVLNPSPRSISAARRERSFALTEVSHAGVPTNDVERALAFWRDLLGLSVAANQPNAEGVCWVEVAGFQFHIFENDERGAAAVHGRTDLPYAEGERTFVFELAGTLARAEQGLAAWGGTWERRVLDFDGPLPALLAQDADGNWVAFVEGPAAVGCAPLAVAAFLGFTHPVDDLDQALREFAGTLGFPQLPRALGDARRPGVGLGHGRKLIFVPDALRADRYNSMDGCPPREFHLNCVGSVSRARQLLKAAGDPHPRESTVRLKLGGGAFQIFTRAPSARMLIEISELTDDPDAGPPA